MIRFILPLLSLFTLAALLPAPLQAATFTWPNASQQLEVNQEALVTLNLNTQGQSINAADVVLNFNSALIEIISITFNSPFDQDVLKNQDAGILKTSSFFLSPSSSYTGSTTYAQIRLKALAAGNTQLAFACQPGNTTDTNLAQVGSWNDLADCASLSPFSITITTPTPPVNNDPDDDQDTDNSSGQPTNTNSYQPANCPVPPSAPTNLRATPYTTSSVLLVWDHSSNASQYTLLYGLKPNQYAYGVSNLGYTNIFLVERLQPATTYYFAVAGSNGCSHSATITAATSTLGNSKPATGTTQTTRPPIAQLPTPTPFIAPTPLPTQIPTITTPVVSQITPPIARLDEQLTPTPKPTTIAEPTPSPEPGQKPVLVRLFLAIFPFIIVLGILLAGAWFVRSLLIYQSHHRRPVRPQPPKAHPSPKSGDHLSKPIPHALQLHPLKDSSTKLNDDF